jgi:hypothetical protein
LRVVKNVTWWELQELLAEGEEFKNTTGKFRGERWTSSTRPHTGQMSGADRMAMERDLVHYGIDYVVWSYATPIGWRRGDGVWVSPDAGYSMTTKTKHLSRLRPAIAELNELAA